MGWATEEPPAGKFLAFEVADIIDQLARQFRKTDETAVFKLLFNPVAGRELMKRALGAVPVQAVQTALPVVDEIYDDRQNTVVDSIWIPGKVSDEGVKVRQADLHSRNEEQQICLASRLPRERVESVSRAQSESR